MLNDFTQRTKRRELAERLAEARRELREQEQTLARLKYEWGIAKRLRSLARSEDEREKWHVQSDVCMGLILQQESVIAEIQESVKLRQKRLAELDSQSSGDAEQ
jgi:hypothetical protein